MKSARSIVAAAIIVVTAAVLLTWLTPGDSGEVLAYARVLDRLQKARTATFALTVQTEPDGQTCSAKSPISGSASSSQSSKVMVTVSVWVPALKVMVSSSSSTSSAYRGRS